ncbi:MAG: hypothetical protein WCK02_05085 [Bacteroidota bacterium]
MFYINKFICRLFIFSLLIVCNLKLFAGPPQYSSAEFKEKFDIASEYFAYQYYAEALPIFKTLLASQPTNSNLNFYVGVCILNSINKRTDAIPFLEKAIKKTSDAYSGSYKEDFAPVFAFYYLAQAYSLEMRFDEARVNFEKFKSFLTTKDKDAKLMADALVQIAATDNAKVIIAKPLKNVVIESFLTVNSIFSDIAPVVSFNENTVYFSSQRKGALGGEKDNLGQYFADIYFTDLKLGKWVKPKRLSGKISSTKIDVISSISPNGKTMYFQRSTENGAFDLYYSKLSKKGKWQTPQKLSSVINTKFNEESVCESSDGMKLFFVSDREGGYGGKDIWISEKDSKGEWGIPYNMGPVINTKYDEASPFLLNDGATLFFSSKGHNSIGGYDIFYSTISDDGFWLNPENIGFPINTTSDDLYYKELPNGKTAYYSSSKQGGWGEMDVFKVLYK